ncbi:Dihydrofolate reductase, partial [hydrothermal vent metagenome]
HFKEITMGKPIIMGRKTFESIGKPLPGRQNIVVSRKGFVAEGVITVSSIEEALQAVQNVPEVMVIGGENLYQQLIDKADQMILTHVDATCEGDAWFPEIDFDSWNIVSEMHYEADKKNNYNFNIVTYQRRY